MVKRHGVKTSVEAVKNIGALIDSIAAKTGAKISSANSELLGQILDQLSPQDQEQIAQNGTSEALSRASLMIQQQADAAKSVEVRMAHNAKDAAGNPTATDASGLGSVSDRLLKGRFFENADGYRGSGGRDGGTGFVRTSSASTDYTRSMIPDFGASGPQGVLTGYTSQIYNSYFKPMGFNDSAARGVASTLARKGGLKGADLVPRAREVAHDTQDRLGIDLNTYGPKVANIGKRHSDRIIENKSVLDQAMGSLAQGDRREFLRKYGQHLQNDQQHQQEVRATETPDVGRDRDAVSKAARHGTIKKNRPMLEKNGLAAPGETEEQIDQKIQKNLQETTGAALQKAKQQDAATGPQVEIGDLEILKAVQTNQPTAAPLEKRTDAAPEDISRDGIVIWRWPSRVARATRRLRWATYVKAGLNYCLWARL